MRSFSPIRSNARWSEQTSRSSLQTSIRIAGGCDCTRRLRGNSPMSIRSPINSWVIALALAGCASLIELERTQLDQDADQVEDTLDNCPRDSNPNQEDIDGDNVGDACSACTDPME